MILLLPLRKLEMRKRIAPLKTQERYTHKEEIQI